MGDGRARRGDGQGTALRRRAAALALAARRSLLTVLYGLARVAHGAAHPVRDGLFAKVGDARGAHARAADLRAHAPLSLRFHLERKTGGLTRVLERGRDGIEELSRFVRADSSCRR